MNKQPNETTGIWFYIKIEIQWPILDIWQDNELKEKIYKGIFWAVVTILEAMTILWNFVEFLDKITFWLCMRMSLC